MKALKVLCRPDWQTHIRENAYQSNVLSDAQQQYWVEALPQPFAIQFKTNEEAAIIGCARSNKYAPAWMESAP